MTKKPVPKRRSPTAARPKPLPFPLFTHEPWYDLRAPNDYLTPILLQMGHHGLERRGYGERSLAPLHSDVLMELLQWQDEMPGRAYEQLGDWRFLSGFDRAAMHAPQFTKCLQVEQIAPHRFS